MLNNRAIHYGSIVFILISWISLIHHAECQEALTCSSSTITISLGYESKHYKYPGSGATYPQSSTCKWLFQASDTSSQILFKVDKLYVDCGDIFVFYSGTSASGTKIGSEICCSSTCSGASRNDQKTTGSDLFLQFISDSSTSTPGDEAGFELYITVGKDASQCSTSSNTPLALSATTTPALLTSPNFFNFYSENYNCTYTYTAATSGYIVTFQFIYLQVELHSGTCYDFVALYDGSSSSSTQIGSLICGDTYQPNQIYNSTGNTMTVYFVSTAGVPKRGFSALVYETDSGATTSGAVDTTSSSVESTTTSETVTTANVATTPTESTSTSSSSSTNVDTSSPEETTSVTSIFSTVNVDTSSPEETTSVTSIFSTVNEEMTPVTSSLSTVNVDTSSPEETTPVTPSLSTVNVDTTSQEETTLVTPVLTTINGSSSGNSSSSTDNSDSKPSCGDGCIAAVVIVVMVVGGGAGGGGGILYYKYSYKPTIGPEKEPGIKDTKITNTNETPKQENVGNKENSNFRTENEKEHANTNENSILTNDNTVTSENITTNGNGTSANEHIT